MCVAYVYALYVRTVYCVCLCECIYVRLFYYIQYNKYMQCT